MSLVCTVRSASARLDHRLGVADRWTLRLNTKRPRALPPSLRCAHASSSLSSAIPAPDRAAVANRIASVNDTATSCDSNPHSATPPSPACHTARGFLPQGLSNTYRRPC